MKKLFAILLAVSFLGFTACSDDNGPEITIVSPENNAVFAPGDVISFDIRITDDVEVRSVTIEGKDGLSLSQSIDLGGFTDMSNISFGFDLTIPDEFVDGEYAMDIEATDNDGNVTTKEFKFRIA